MGKSNTEYNITMETQSKTTQQVTPPEKRNPTGKGGFGDNPQNRNPGGWKKDQSISYQYNFLIRLKVDEFREWLQQHPESQRTMAQELAYQAVLKARKEIKYLQEITDRVEGKSKMSTDITSNGETINKVLVEFINGKENPNTS